MSPPPTRSIQDMISDALDKMRSSYRRMAEHMPMHGDFIARLSEARTA